ncbi:MAG: dihydroorotate dehydrogenase electron transfer subunit [Deltaproteobacteria bacterium]|nr:dihydroorotate dehydrogenase electron transfer subunit [Deltaproteobacteria bacterium]
MKVQTAKILYNKEAAPGYFRIGLSWKKPAIKAGQFVMLRVDTGGDYPLRLDPLLRRPLGVYRSIGAGVELLYQVVGKGTRILSEKTAGEFLSLLGPLGNGFPAPPKGKKVILVAGGMGIASLFMFAARLKGATLLFGARAKAETAVADDFKRLGLKIKISTQDGSVGKKGLVTELLKDEITDDSVVYACGPAGMLKAVSRICHSGGVTCRVSLERAMACGIGVCLGCAVKTNPHAGRSDNRVYQMICSDGPVFDAGDIDWDAF